MSASRPQHAALHLVKLDRLKERLEIALAKAFVALAFDDLVKHRPNHRLGEDLPQQALLAAIDQDLVALQAIEVLAVARQPLVDQLVIGVGRVEEFDVAGTQRLDSAIDVRGRQSDVLDALAVIGLEIFLDLVNPARVAAGLVDRDADFAVGASQRAALDAGQLALNVEITNLPEIEEPLVEPGPHIHASLMDVVRQMVDRRQADALRRLLDARYRHKIDVVDRATRAVAVDEVDEAAADALDRRDVQLHRADPALDRLGAELDRPAIGQGRVGDPKRDGTNARAVKPREALRKAFRLGIDDEIDIALTIKRHPFRAMPGDGAEPHALEHRSERRRVGRGVFDELEPVRAHGIIPLGVVPQVATLCRHFFASCPDNAQALKIVRGLRRFRA